MTPGSTILVVEDDPEVRRFAVRTLEHHGHNVLVRPRQARAWRSQRAVTGSTSS